MLRRVVYIFVAASLLSSCAEQRARMEAQRQAQIAATSAADDARCRSYGAAPGTQTYADCRTAIIMREVSAINADAAQQAAFSNSMLTAGAMVMSNQPAPLPPPQIQFPVRCRSMPVGGAVQTMCQ